MSPGIWAAFGPGAAPARRRDARAWRPSPAATSTSSRSRDVSRHYGRRRALVARHARAAAPGQIVGLFGPNGAGKSTLLGVLVDARPADVRRRALRRRAGSQTLGDAPARRASACSATICFSTATSPRARTSSSSAACTACAIRRGARRRGARGRAPRPIAPTIACPGSRAACASGWRSSARSCTSRGSCCSTSRSPVSTTSRRRCWSARLRALRASGRDRRHGDARLRERGRAGRSRDLSRAGPAAVDVPARAARCASAIAHALRREPRRDERPRAPPGSSRGRISSSRRAAASSSYTTLFFAVACVLVFSFALRARRAGRSTDAAAGILWVAIAFSGTLALGRAFERERQARDAARAAARAGRARRRSISASCSALLVLMAGVEIVLVPIVGLLFHAPLGRAPWLLAGAARDRHDRLRRGRHALRRDARARALARRAAAGAAVSDHRAGASSRGVQGTAAIFARRAESRRWPGPGSRC